VVTPTGKLEPGACVEVTVTGVLPQLLYPNGAAQVTVALQVVLVGPVLAVLFGGQPEMTGFTELLTVTLKLQVLLTSCASVNV
jgi:hypothetical protein